MRDVWFGFMNLEQREPEVQTLHESIRESKGILYAEFNGGADLGRRLSLTLKEWSIDQGPKMAHTVDLKPASGVPILEIYEARRRAPVLESMGQPEEARRAYEFLATHGSDSDRLDYSRFLRHANQLEEAEAVAQKVVDATTLKSPHLDPNYARGHASLAKIRSRRGDNQGALARLTTLVGTLPDPSESNWTAWAEILDDLGLLQKKMRRLPESRASLERSLEIRSKFHPTGDHRDTLAQLGRLDVDEERWSLALQKVDELMKSPRACENSYTSANCWLFAAQVQLRCGQVGDALESAAWSIAINRHFGEKRNEAMGRIVSCQALKRENRWEEARTEARLALSLNQEIGDPDGERRAKWHIADIENLRQGHNVKPADN